MTSNRFEELARLGVATVYEARGRQGLIDHEWQQLIPGTRVAGPARIALCAPGDNRAVHEAVASVQKGEVLVLTMDEPAAVGIIGGLLVTQMRVAGAAGVLVNAAVRDSDELREIGLPIWHRWVRARGATKDTRGSIDVPVRIGGTLISPGDVVILDADGAAAVPADEVEDALSTAREREQKESAAMERYLEGALSYDQHGFREQDRELDKDT